jgi:(p)ppGpp synthase/HD superfamily hydrolase
MWAATFASAAHSGFLRKYTGDPYFSHPRGVARIIRSISHTKAQEDGAYLHDTVEESDARRTAFPVTLTLIEALFGNETATIVHGVTPISRLSDGSRSIRKAIDRKHYASGSSDIQTVKLADTLHNMHSVFDHDAHFGVVYHAEAILLLEDLTEADPLLRLHLANLLRKQASAFRLTGR